jgi:hypothetical protein
MMSLKILELSYVTSVSLRRELIIRKLLTSFPIYPSCIYPIVKLVPELVADNLPPLVKFQPATITGGKKANKKDAGSATTTGVISHTGNICASICRWL